MYLTVHSLRLTIVVYFFYFFFKREREREKTHSNFRLKCVGNQLKKK